MHEVCVCVCVCVCEYTTIRWGYMIYDCIELVQTGKWGPVYPTEV